MKRMRLLCGVALGLFVTDSALAANSVVIQSKSVWQNATNVTVGVHLQNDLPVRGIVLPFEIRSITPGAFIKTSITQTPQSRLVTPGWTAFRNFYGSRKVYAYQTSCPLDSAGKVWAWSAADSNADFISPDAIMYAGYGSDEFGKVVAGDDGVPGVGTPSLVLTFNVTSTLGSFEIDTTCIPMSNHLSFVNWEDLNQVPVLIVPTFTKGVITIAPRTLSGHITHADTLAYNVNLTGDVTIDTGVTLTVMPGASISAIGSSDDQHGGIDTNRVEIIVKGTLCVPLSGSGRPTFGCTIDSAGKWYGVRILTGGHFKSGIGAVIKDARVGVRIEKGAQPDTLSGVTVRNCDSVGFWYSSGTLPLRADSYKAKVDLGTSPSGLGNNDISTDSSGCSGCLLRRVYHSGSDSLKAEGNWWGSASPSAGWFSGKVDWNPYLSSPPAGKLMMPDEQVESVALPTEFTVSQNYPNPFNAATAIEFSLSSPSHVKVTVFNILGQVVTDLADEDFAAGRHHVDWNAANSRGEPVASGIYFYRVTAGHSVESRKMVLLK
ncbi:MAG: T9SS type A sorting domain-containing protein [candidate division Zixibacteria bacterium]|nr:T9SS type A sorting domain-containing protein [candidate division Zixibacteria bacterium]